MSFSPAPSTLKRSSSTSSSSNGQSELPEETQSDDQQLTKQPTQLIHLLTQPDPLQTNYPHPRTLP
ncbi:uncharacterized protein PGTG_21454 [Puccinia graminis f. sp. tritici CRL 75-36-700-3]|uniref:Uncharacterized protein n=1 Tax=Puccinia graminis f. sp. tritici (strain CRL 75-36-700-3 / race SCCL) TaxID=418459 RepID=H6QRH7_PUCGT|nr:uncharacterized protein PGTG_21454 [Puccinia graminis f. sp. tritici CRL 75-36-700-3]EHS63259.1 hypothetical protein PGTG_21454 [Puccinia graminis f. sp. tritici CRL 75-36-700-3]